MPIYEYNCPKDGRFEAIKPMSDGRYALCPCCGQRVDRIMSACNWSFGWRISDRSMNQIGAPRDELVRNI